MNGRFLLDTNIIIALFAQELPIQEHLGQAEEVFVPSIVLGELYFGAHKSTRVEENVTRVDEFAASSAILVCDTETARRYGAIKSRLREIGRPIPENDLWIAVIAQQYDLILVTRDAHFSVVERLNIETW